MTISLISLVVLGILAVVASVRAQAWYDDANDTGLIDTDDYD